MARRMWLLIEWLKENDMFSSYGVVNTDSVMGGETSFDVGKIIFVPNKHNKGTRRAKILRISENKNDVKELKVLLEKQDNQMKSVLSLCMNTLKDMKTNTMFLDRRQSNRGDESDSSTDDNEENDEQNLNFSNLNVFSRKRPSLSISKHHSLTGIKQNPFTSRRSLISSSPYPDSSKLTFDQGTQTDEYDSNLIKVEQLETMLRKLYQQFLSLIGESGNTQSTNPLEFSETEISEFDIQNIQSEKLLLRKDVSRDLRVDTPPNTLLVDIVTEDTEKQAKRPCIRRASAQTTNTGLANSEHDSDMIPLGAGTTKLPVTLINTIDWSSYTTATRQLLKALFPRKILATHSLTGKQSPAFTNKPPKQALDPKVVNDIVDTVSEVCGVSKRIVRSCITTKCTDEAKLYRNRQLFKRNNEYKESQENTAPSPSSNENNLKTE